MKIKIIIDSHTKNYFVSNSMERYDCTYLFKDVPTGTNISKTFRPKTKTSQESRDIGKINTSGFLCSEHATRVNQFLKDFDHNKYDLIVTMGTVSSFVFTEGLNMKNASSKIHDTAYGKVFCTYHPDTMIVDKYRSESFKKDFDRIMDFLHDEDKPLNVNDSNVDIEIHSRVFDFSNMKGEIAIDTETFGNVEIDTLACCAKVDDKSIVVEYPDDYTFSTLQDKTLVFQNMSYDLEFMSQNYSFEFDEESDFHDIMLISKCLFPMNRHSLDDIEKYHVGTWPSWKQNLKLSRS